MSTDSCLVFIFFSPGYCVFFNILGKSWLIQSMLAFISVVMTLVTLSSVMALLWEHSQWPEFKAVILALFPFPALIRLSLWSPWPFSIQYSLENVARVKCFIKLDSYRDDAVMWNAEYQRSTHWVFTQSLALQMIFTFLTVFCITQNLSWACLSCH